MIMTDPIADTLICLYNTSSAYHEPANVPYSKMKVAIASVLQTESYIKGYQIEEAWVGKILVLNLRYDTKRERAISDAKHVSKPGLRIYAKSNRLSKVVSGPGVAIIPLSSGLLINREAAGKGVGGEVIAYIW